MSLARLVKLVVFLLKLQTFHKVPTVGSMILIGSPSNRLIYRPCSCTCRRCRLPPSVGSLHKQPPPSLSGSLHRLLSEQCRAMLDVMTWVLNLLTLTLRQAFSYRTNRILGSRSGAGLKSLHLRTFQEAKGALAE